MARKFRGLEGACAPFLGPLAGQAGTHLALWMDLQVKEQGYLLAKDLADKRVGFVDPGSVEQRNPCSLSLTTVSPDPQPQSRPSLGIQGPHRWKEVLGGKLV